MQNYVQMTVGGRQAMVPAEHAKKVQKKQFLVAYAMRLQKCMEADADVYRAIYQKEIEKTMGKIIRLSRRIPPCVKFI
jgi:hypothetical protein